MALVDTAGPLRNEDALDIDKVTRWLRGHVPLLKGKPAVTQFSGGASNLTYRLVYETDDFILRRPPVGTKAHSAHDMAREFHLQSALKPLYHQVPDMVALCEDLGVAGSPFYVMRRVEGIIPRKNFPPELTLSAAQTRAICLNFLDALIRLHLVDVSHPSLQRFHRGQGYVRRQVEGWSERFEKAHTWNVPRARAVIRWLKTNTPSDERSCLIHNDFRLDNVILDQQQPSTVLAVLDWEMATVGCPLMDVGCMLAYWTEAGDNVIARQIRRQPTHLPGMLTRAEVKSFYADRTGFDLSAMQFYEVFGQFRLAAIVQQIYFRYHHRQTHNPRFKNFWLLVHYLLRQCRVLISQKA